MSALSEQDPKEIDDWQERTYCLNGGCTKPPYRTKHCFRCWSGSLFDCMRARVQNQRNYYPQWAGKELAFTRREFIAWVRLNPPPADMARPSIDRMDPSGGYTFTNIRWLEARQNSRGPQHDVPLTHQHCPHCRTIKPLTAEHFHRNRSRGLGFQTYCKPCRKEMKYGR